MDWCTVVVIISFIVAGSINCESIADNGSAKHHEQNRFVKLICRDDTTIVVGIENEFGEAHMIGKIGETYMVIINNRDESKLPPKTVYLIKKPIAVVKNLIPLTSYNISADLMKGDFQYTAKKLFMEFQTLDQNYVPGNVTNIYTDEFLLSADGNGVDVTVSWDPNEDRTCAYSLFFHTRDYNPENELFSVREFNQNHPEELFRHELKQLQFGTEYAIGVQALNVKNETLKSTIWWHVITTPSCLELNKNNGTLCSPYHPENITVEVESTTDNKRYNFNVTWHMPTVFPNYYTLDIIDYESGLRQIFNVSNGTTNSVQLNNIEVNGLNFEIFVTAHSTGGESTGFYRGKIDPAIIYQQPSADYSTIAIVTGSLLAVMIIVAILFVKLKLWRHAKHIRAQIKFEAKSPSDSIIYDSQYRTKEQLDQICGLQSDFNFDDDPMELDPTLVQTLEIIGEGAFGCVRRAILLPDKHIVAVKMLKSFPSYADVRNFYREIEVMKSVPTHPNIVGIVGHCTKNVFGLMLLTEYCSEGNLLNFLRNIFDDQLWEQDRVRKGESLQSDSSDPNMHFTNELRKDSAYTSKSSSRISIAENHGYDFDLSASRMCIVENHGYGFDIGNNQVEKAITEIDLLSFAYQVANGMDFLSKKKVVHRDLACRNVLVLADRTAKISDFGLSRDIYQENLYKKSGAGLLPIKWLALESMTHQVYSTQSDVWSFGVLLYEIVTKGAVPYPTVDTKDILSFLKDGRRMERPNGCRADIYNLMLNCWNTVPTERPTFKIIKDELAKIMREMNASSLM
ncbi:tyrosine-protein kinase receptor torso-like [Bradysia coprophila]|uniref:tyrosine-protein kinase receptor torso-like n=1 Tax=Bradysia coprophila TaxID=38358 RepID=UPI00187D9EA7|nr:tyrosine-protein kinase receptor torso-like [Bradysia coprophila]XP_037051904.1 tyrosine-protein kinase receptor torso-like [Bradysia coprophila]